jgi:hypothetical protein
MSKRLYLDQEILERLAADERKHRRQQVRYAVILAVSLALGAGAIVYALNELGKSQPEKVVIDPAKLPPIPPGPPR